MDARVHSYVCFFVSREADIDAAVACFGPAKFKSSKAQGSKGMALFGGMEVAVAIPAMGKVGCHHLKCVEACKTDGLVSACEGVREYKQACTDALERLSMPDDCDPPVRSSARIVASIEKYFASSATFSTSLMERSLGNYQDLISTAKQELTHDTFDIIEKSEGSDGKDELNGPDLLRRSKSKSAKSLRAAWKKCNTILDERATFKDMALELMPDATESLTRIAKNQDNSMAADWTLVNSAVASCLVVQAIFGAEGEERAASVASTVTLVAKLRTKADFALPSKLGLAFSALADELKSSS